MTIRFAITVLVLPILFATGCVHHTTVQDFGLKAPATPRIAASPDVSLRDVFQQQKKGPLSNALPGDPRIAKLQNQVKLNPADAAARLELAGIYEAYRLYDQALEQFTAALSLAPSEKAILGIVRCDQALNRTWQAIPLLEQFLKESPSAALWNVLGLMQDTSSDLIAGERALREAVAADPASDQWRNNLGYNLLLQNKTDEAEEEFQKALELNPNSLTTHNNFGILLARRGDLESALKEFQFGADEATAHNNLAVVLMEIGKYEQSREQLVKALALRRNFAPALSNFKLVQERMHQRAESQKAGQSPRRAVRVAAAGQDVN